MSNGEDLTQYNNSSTYTIGVMIDSVESFINASTVTYLLEAVEEYNIHPVFFFGGTLDPVTISGRYAYTYSLPDRISIQALVVFPHSICPQNPAKTTEEILKRFPGIPVYSFYAPLDSHWSIYSNEEAAIEKMVQHLVDIHKLTKIAVLTGPLSENNLSSNRLSLLKKALQTYNVSLSPYNIFEGTFTGSSGKNTVQSILTRSDPAPEVLLCMNDRMALGAIREFNNRGISIPEDILVVGFDDILETAGLHASLTTISYPIWDMITALIHELYSNLTGISPYTPTHTALEAQFLQRESCGCIHHLKPHKTEDEAETTSQTPAKQVRINQLRESLDQAINSCIKEQDPSIFQQFMESALIIFSRNGDLTNSFIELFSTQWTVSLLKNTDTTTQIFINSLFVDALRLLIQRRTQTFARARQNDRGRLVFYEICNEILSQKQTLTNSLRILASNLNLLDINRCCVILLIPDEPDKGEIRLSYKAGVFQDVPETDLPRYPVQTLIAEAIQSIHEPVAILSLAYKNITYGFLFMSVTDKQFEQFPLIQDIISRIIDSAMTNELLSCHIQTLTQSNTMLSQLSILDEFTGLFNRRALYVNGKMMYQKALEQGSSFCIIFLDMDGLKTINDTYGHKDGDIAIFALSGILKKSFREQDQIVRFGGDEFIVIMSNIKETTLHRTLDRITRQIDDFNSSGIHTWKLSVSWGYVFSNKADSKVSFETLIEESDAVLYEQKRIKKSKKE